MISNRNNLNMMNSEIKEIIFKIFELLDESYITREIDSPIDKSVAEFKFDTDCEYSHQKFHKQIANVVQIIYRNGLKVPKNLSLPTALAEGILLLEKGYQNNHTTGYDAAIIDASNPDINGLELIKASLIEIIKNTERQKYIEWVFIVNIVPTNWETKCEIIEFLFQIYKPYLPPSVQQNDPIYFANSYKELILNNINSSQIISQLASGVANIF